MRMAVILFVTGLLPAQMASADDVRSAFQGTGAGDTPSFTVPDRWEAQWNGPPCNVTIESSDGTVLAGSSSMGPGSIYCPQGGTYKLHISMASNFPWHVTIVPVGPPGTQAVAGNGVPYYSPPDMTPRNAQPDIPSTQSASTTFSGNPVPSVVQTGTPSVEPVRTRPSGPPVNLSDAQARAIVLIKGDHAEGTGFLVKTAGGPMVVTNQHVLANNPHVEITTASGDVIKQQGLIGAADRDLAMIPIQDNNYSYLELASDLGRSVQVGDQVITPGNSQGGEVMLNTQGTVLALGPQRVEFSNPIYHGNSGGPVLHVKSGKVIGVVTEAMKVDTSNALDKASFSNQNSAISGDMRYFGLRLDSVSHWDPYTWDRFNNETLFLSQFHERSKCLDSYLNTASKDVTPWGLYYLRDDKVKEANEHLADMASGGDSSQHMEAWRNLIFDLSSVADTDMDQIQQPSNFYSYDQSQARDEMAYRQSLKKEVDDLSNDISRASNLARRN